MRGFASLFCAGALLLPATALHAQAGYPNRPIRLIVPYPPGAGTDIIARTVGQKLGEILGQQIVIDNRGGGGGVIGADAGAKAPPDGYTMVLVTSTFAMTPTLQKPPYDPVRDFTPLVLLAAVPNILVVNPSIPAANLQELIALARSRELSYATSGNGTVSHLRPNGCEVRRRHAADARALQGQRAGADRPARRPRINHVFRAALGDRAYRHGSRAPPRDHEQIALGCGAASADIRRIGRAGFRVQLRIRPPDARAHAARDRRAAQSRNRQNPAPARVRERLAGQGAEPVGNTPEEYAVLLKADLARWAKVVKAAAIRAD